MKPALIGAISSVRASFESVVNATAGYSEFPAVSFAQCVAREGAPERQPPQTAWRSY